MEVETVTNVYNSFGDIVGILSRDDQEYIIMESDTLTFDLILELADWIKSLDSSENLAGSEDDISFSQGGLSSTCKRIVQGSEKELVDFANEATYNIQSPKAKRLDQKQAERNDHVLERLRFFNGNNPECSEDIADQLDKVLDFLQGDDIFGTEGQLDPRGDCRVNQWTMWNVQGVDCD